MSRAYFGSSFAILYHVLFNYSGIFEYVSMISDGGRVRKHWMNVEISAFSFFFSTSVGKMLVREDNTIGRKTEVCVYMYSIITCLFQFVPVLSKSTAFRSRRIGVGARCAFCLEFCFMENVRFVWVSHTSLQRKNPK